jgi:hypothetical protein
MPLGWRLPLQPSSARAASEGWIWENWTIRFGKPYSSVFPETLDCALAQSSSNHVGQAKPCLTGHPLWSTPVFALRPKCVSTIRFDCCVISIDRDLCLYRQHDIALWHRYDIIFLKQTKSQILIGPYLFWENQNIQNPKSKHPVFMTSSFWLEFLLSWSFNALSPFSMLKTPLDIQIFEFSSFFGTAKIGLSGPEIGTSCFISLAKFGHQHMPLPFS